MPLNPCKNNWELCLKEELGVIGMQNKNVALETGGGFLPPVECLPVTAPDQARFELGAKAEPLPEAGGQGWEGKLGDAGAKGTPLLPGGSQPCGGIKQRPAALPAPATPQHPHHPHFGVKR